MAQGISAGDEPDEFKADLDTYRRLRFKLTECESAGIFDESLVDEIVLLEDRLMAAAATSLIVVLTKFEIATIDLPSLHHPWISVIRTDMMQLGGLDASPLGAPLF